MKEKRYNFDKTAKFYEFCAKDELRPTFNNIFFESGNIISTDGYILVVCPISEISNLKEKDIRKLNNKMINWKDFKKLLSLSEISISDEEISGFKFVEGKYANYKKVIDSYKDEELRKEISFDATKLAKLTEIFNRYPILTPNRYSMMKVRIAGSNMKCFIMPKCIEKQDEIFK